MTEYNHKHGESAKDINKFDALFHFIYLFYEWVGYLWVILVVILYHQINGMVRSALEMIKR